MGMSSSPTTQNQYFVASEHGHAGAAAKLPGPEWTAQRFTGDTPLIFHWFLLTQQNKNFVAFGAELCYNIDVRSLSKWPTGIICSVTSAPGFLVTSVINELLIAAVFLKSNLFQNVLFEGIILHVDA